MGSAALPVDFSTSTLERNLESSGCPTGDVIAGFFSMAALLCNGACMNMRPRRCRRTDFHNCLALQARTALRFPWWTLKSSFEDIQKLSQLEGDAQQVRNTLDMQSSIGKKGIPPGMAAARSPNQICMHDADFLLNTVAAGQSDWDEIRTPLADKYAEAGLSAVADFVRVGGS